MPRNCATRTPGSRSQQTRRADSKRRNQYNPTIGQGLDLSSSIPTAGDISDPRALELRLRGSQLSSRAQYSRFQDIEDINSRPNSSLTMSTAASYKALQEPSPFPRSGQSLNVGFNWMAGPLADESNPDGGRSYEVYGASWATQPGEKAESRLSSKNPSRAYRASGITQPGDRAESRPSDKNRPTRKESKKLLSFSLFSRKQDS